jgi:hypothetical protein
MRKCSRGEIGSFRLRSKPEGAGAWHSAEVFLRMEPCHQIRCRPRFPSRSSFLHASCLKQIHSEIDNTDLQLD